MSTKNIFLSLIIAIIICTAIYLLYKKAHDSDVFDKAWVASLSLEEKVVLNSLKTLKSGDVVGVFDKNTNELQHLFLIGANNTKRYGYTVELLNFEDESFMKFTHYSKLVEIVMSKDLFLGVIKKEHLPYEYEKNPSLTQKIKFVAGLSKNEALWILDSTYYL